MPRASHVCTTPGCPTLTDSGQCPDCRAKSERKRGTPQQRGYGKSWAKRRPSYLKRHPVCVLCGGASEVPDHHPRSRRELVAARVVNPDADEYLRPVCIPCHNAETAKHQPGGWAAW